MSEKIEEYKRKLEAFEQHKQEIAQSINIKELVKKSKEIRSVYIDGLGEIKYGPLTFGDLIEINKYQSSEERTIAIVYCMLRKANQEITVDDVKSLPLDMATKILTAIGKDSGFLATTR